MALFYNYSQGSGYDSLSAVAGSSGTLEFHGRSQAYEGMRLTARLKTPFASVRNNVYGVVSFPLMHQIQTARVINCQRGPLDSRI